MRDAAYHQGTVWSWLIGPFIDAWLKTNPENKKTARDLLVGFERSPPILIRTLRFPPLCRRHAAADQGLSPARREGRRPAPVHRPRGHPDPDGADGCAGSEHPGHDQCPDREQDDAEVVEERWDRRPDQDLEI